MRRVRYQVACSLDGYIAGPNGEIDWIRGGSDYDFAGLYAQFDTLLMGRRTYEQLPGGGAGEHGGKRVVVGSRTLKAEDHAGVEVVGAGLTARVAELKAMAGKDIWLFGGGDLFRSLAVAGLVDTIEPAIIPVVLGGGVRMYPESGVRLELTLTGQRAYEGGMVLLEYAVRGATARLGLAAAAGGE
jgi:dihydrofolate reductase